MMVVANGLGLGHKVYNPSGGVSAPVNTVAPSISGSIAPGSTLTTTNGTWINTPTGFTLSTRDAVESQHAGTGGTSHSVNAWHSSLLIVVLY